MSLKIRQVSILLRHWESWKDRRRVLRTFDEWREGQRVLPPPRAEAKRLLIIRLDDIGDYLLFRNQLETYKRSPRWRGHAITLLGNASWKEVFTKFDSNTVDEAIWVHKNRYLYEAEYRFDTWRRIRALGVDTVITPSRTRPPLLDDLCMLAAAPSHTLGCINTYIHTEWNRKSDALYSQLFTPTDPLMHEFRFNADFAQWACGVAPSHSQPIIEHSFEPRPGAAHLICFIGANTRSKRWPAHRWIEFIQRYREHHGAKVVLAGAGGAEERMAELIRERTGADSIVGKVSLTEFVEWVAGAAAVVTNDTMAAHMAASCNRPTVIVANGVNYMRFTEYTGIDMKYVVTVYPAVFNRRRRRVGDGLYDYIDAVSADIASITADRVMEALAEAAANHPSGSEDALTGGESVLGHEKSGRIPGLSGHTAQ